MFAAVPIPGVSVSEFWNVTSGSHDLCVLNGTDSERGKVYLYGDDPGKQNTHAVYKIKHIYSGTPLEGHL